MPGDLELAGLEPAMPFIEHLLHDRRFDPDYLADVFRIDERSPGGLLFSSTPLPAVQTENLRGPIWEALAAAAKNAGIDESDTGSRLIDESYFSNFGLAQHNPDCWAAAFNLSGVAWKGAGSRAFSARRRCHLIGDRAYVAAAHFAPAPGGTKRFIAPDGSQFEMTIEKEFPLGNDGMIGLFTAPVDPKIKRYPIETAPKFGQWCLCTRTRTSQTVMGESGTEAQRVSWERVSSHPGMLEAPFIYPSPTFGQLVNDGGVGYHPAVFFHLSRWMSYRDYANTYDSSDAVFTSDEFGNLSLLSTYTSPTNGCWYGHPRILSKIDDFLAQEGETREGQGAPEEFAQKIAVIGDHGDAAEPGQARVSDYILNILDEGALPILEAGDCNYPEGAFATLAANKAVWAAKIAAEKYFVCHGNHDADTQYLGGWFSGIHLFSFGTQWEHSDVTPPNDDWRNDPDWVSGWDFGNGQFGFGDPVINTHLTPGSDVYYFRKKVWYVQGPDPTRKVRIRLQADDGCRLWVNGVEVYSYNVPNEAGPNEPASRNVDSGNTVWGEDTVHEFLIDAEHLVAGDNLFAAQVHQAPASSDLKWDMTAATVTTATISVPSKADADAGLSPLRHTNGFGQPLADLLPYLPGAGKAYRHDLDPLIDLFVINDGIRTDGAETDPGGITEDSPQAQWLKTQLAASAKPYKMVAWHRPSVAPHDDSSRYDVRLAWEFLKDHPGLIICNGHTHNTYHLVHESGMHIVNASNVAKGPREITEITPELFGEAEGWVSVYANGQDGDETVALVEANTSFLRVRFLRERDDALVHSFTVAAP